MQSPPVSPEAPGAGSTRRRAAGGQRRAEQGGLSRIWASFSGKLAAVDSKYFNRGIMVAILTNTLSMGVEYHEQVAPTQTAFRVSLGHVPPACVSCRL